MRLLIACEFSGVVRRAFRERGHDVISCDLLPAEDGSEFHIQGDVLAILRDGWDGVIAHPPCTRLTVAGARWFKGKEAEQAEAIAFVEAIWNAGIPRTAIENPIGVLSTRSKLGKPTQIIQPWQFGHPEFKATCLWLRGFPSLMETNNVFAEAEQLPRNKSHRVHFMTPGPDRWKERSRTYTGIAAAMAEQWGDRLEQVA